MENARVEKLSMSHRKIYTDIIVDASPAQVWTVLTDTGAYKQWAAFLVDIQGEISDAANITAVFQLNSQKEKLTPVSHKIHVVDGEEFYWAEKGPGGIRDNHHFRVEAFGNGQARFIQSDEIMGGLTWLMGGNLSKMYVEGYQAFNRGLKREVEQRAGLS